MKRVCVTGGNGFLGSSVVAALSEHPDVELVVSGDLRDPAHPLDGVVYERVDVTDETKVFDLFRRYRVDTVVHLAAIVDPGPSVTRDIEYRVDVGGTRNVVAACLSTGVHRIVVSSSGAAYGYHPDNPSWIDEDQPLRGNQEFAYSHHKRLVEEFLADTRARHPELQQVVFRIGTILGNTVDNQITALFERKRILKVAGSDSPFVFIWDADVVACMVRAATDGPVGIFNLAGDGALTVPQLALMLGRPRLVVPAWLLVSVLVVAKTFRLSRYGPEQVRFLRYRPVLLNTRLKQVFGYTPSRSSRDAFLAWQQRPKPSR